MCEYISAYFSACGLKCNAPASICMFVRCVSGQTWRRHLWVTVFCVFYLLLDPKVGNHKVVLCYYTLLEYFFLDNFLLFLSSFEYKYVNFLSVIFPKQTRFFSTQDTLPTQNIAICHSGNETQQSTHFLVRLRTAWTNPTDSMFRSNSLCIILTGGEVQLALHRNDW